jgi:hypothetical protein
VTGDLGQQEITATQWLSAARLSGTLSSAAAGDAEGAYPPSSKVVFCGENSAIMSMWKESRNPFSTRRKRTTHAFGRKAQPSTELRHRSVAVRFSGTLPGPFALSDRSLGSYVRQLALRRQRLERLKTRSAAKGFVVSPQRVHAPRLAKPQALERELGRFPTRRRLLKRSEFRVYADVLRRMRRTLAALIHRVQGCAHRDRQERYLARIGRILLDAPDEVLESFIVGRRNQSGRNLHAAAMARMRAANLRPEQLSEWGRRGRRRDWTNASLGLTRRPHPPLRLLH